MRLALVVLELVIVAGEFHGGIHGLVLERPVAGVAVDIGAAVLQEDAEGSRFGFADPERDVVGAAHVDERSDQVENAVEDIGAVPGSHEGADRAGAGAGDGVVIRVGGEIDGFGDGGDQLFEQEVREIGADVVIFPVPAEAGKLGVGRGGGKDAGVDEDGGHGREFAFGDEVVEDDRDARAVARVAVAVEEDHVRRGFGRVDFGGNVDLIVVRDAGIDFAGRQDGFGESAFGDAGLDFGIRSEIRGLGLREGGAGGQGRSEKKLVHGVGGRCAQGDSIRRCRQAKRMPGTRSK